MKRAHARNTPNASKFLTRARAIRRGAITRLNAFQRTAALVATLLCPAIAHAQSDPLDLPLDPNPPIVEKTDLLIGLNVIKGNPITANDHEYAGVWDTFYRSGESITFDLAISSLATPLDGPPLISIFFHPQVGESRTGKRVIRVGLNKADEPRNPGYACEREFDFEFTTLADSFQIQFDDGGAWTIVTLASPMLNDLAVSLSDICDSFHIENGTYTLSIVSSGDNLDFFSVLPYPSYRDLPKSDSAAEVPLLVPLVPPEKSSEHADTGEPVVTLPPPSLMPEDDIPVEVEVEVEVPERNGSAAFVYRGVSTRTDAETVQGLDSFSLSGFHDFLSLGPFSFPAFRGFWSGWSSDLTLETPDQEFSEYTSAWFAGPGVHLSHAIGSHHVSGDVFAGAQGDQQSTYLGWHLAFAYFYRGPISFFAEAEGGSDPAFPFLLHADYRLPWSFVSGKPTTATFSLAFFSMLEPSFGEAAVGYETYPYNLFFEPVMIDEPLVELGPTVLSLTAGFNSRVHGDRAANYSFPVGLSWAGEFSSGFFWTVGGQYLADGGDGGLAGSFALGYGDESRRGVRGSYTHQDFAGDMVFRRGKLDGTW